MKYYLFLLFSAFAATGRLYSADRDSSTLYRLPDSVKAVSFLTSVRVQQITGNKRAGAGISAGPVSLALAGSGKSRKLEFVFPASARVVAAGLDITQAKKGRLSWLYPWKEKEDYKLMLAAAPDSAGNFVLYSAYCWLPADKKWKLVGTCRIDGQWETIRNPGTFYTAGRRKNVSVAFSGLWIQRSNGSWKNLLGMEQETPVINLLSHVDSLRQFIADTQRISRSDLTASKNLQDNGDGIFYRVLREGNGRQVRADDTVTVFYKLTLLNDTAVIDQAKEKPATFPLKRLIRGWQIGVPLSKTGGSILLVIPSAHAYSIRTRSPKIPPNSILVFEIEVADARPAL